MTARLGISGRVDFGVATGRHANVEKEDHRGLERNRDWKSHHIWRVLRLF
jgi:hypothetical protein